MKLVRSSRLRTGRLYPQEFHGTESTLEHMVPSVASEKIPSDTSGIDPETFQLAAQCLNHYATPGPFLESIDEKKNNAKTKCCPLLAFHNFLSC
jgi:hypothetical protein